MSVSRKMFAHLFMSISKIPTFLLLLPICQPPTFLLLLHIIKPTIFLLLLPIGLLPTFYCSCRSAIPLLACCVCPFCPCCCCLSARPLFPFVIALSNTNNFLSKPPTLKLLWSFSKTNIFFLLHPQPAPLPYCIVL